MLCSYYRPLSDHQTWPIAAVLLSRTYHAFPSATRQPFSVKIKNRRSAFRPRARRIDRIAQETFTNDLHDILQQGKGIHGLTDREDTYVSVRELLNYRHFQKLTFPDLQKVVKGDRLHRFELLYQPLKGRDTDSWWIRVKQRMEKDIRLDPIIFSDNVGTAIYGTTLEDWRSYISLKGISRRNDNYIQISRGVPLQDYFTSSSPISTQVLIHVNVKHAINIGIRFFLSSRPSPFSAPPMPSLQHLPQNHSLTSGRGASSLASRFPAVHSDSPSRATPFAAQIQPPPQTKSPIATAFRYKSTKILTPGNEFGFLPPECFAKVEVVRVKRKPLWTLDGEAAEQVPSDNKEKNTILTSDIGSAEDVKKYIAVDTRPKREYRTGHVEKSLDQFFIDLPIDHQVRAVHPDLKKEALATFST